MTDDATLQERLRVGLMAVAAFVRGNADAKERVYDAIDAVEEATARIAELEAEVARLTPEPVIVTPDDLEADASAHEDAH